MNTNQKIAQVHLTTRFKQLLVAVLSVTFGISMYVFMNSFMAGVNNAQTQITFTSMPHIKIYNDLPTDVDPILNVADPNTIVIINNARNIQYAEGIKNADEIKNKLLHFNEITGVTQQLNQNVFVRNGVSKTSASLSGIEIEGENELFETAKYIVEGDLEELDRRSDGIILGTGLARAIGVNTSNNILLTTSEGITKTFKVIGLIETGSNAADKTRALVSIHTARQLFSKNKSYATEVLLNIADYYKAQSLSEEISKLTDYKVEAWQEGNAQLDAANVLRDIVAVAISLTILIVAGFGIYNIMNMTVNEKIKEIAILKAMGFNGKDVIEIFLAQSIVIGFMGGITGLVLGNIIVRLVDNVPFKIATLTTLPVEYSTADYVMAFCFGIIITFIAGYLPARKASKVDPVEILRG
ncbi:MAG: FtsX-like permease family protein [Reichenbachiella sp.]|uniref:ABC transporter permease n=1 Tax=Reichenbachiella sp. TaxID=2184521 RepID=UPI00329A1904